jgi:hypothetical protein
VLAGHRPQSTEADTLRDQGRDPRKFQGNTRAVRQLLTLISRHRLLSRWDPFLDAVNNTIEALTTNTQVVFMEHKPSDPGDDPFPDSLTWFSRMGRPLNTLKEIALISA